jgi:hypothetical protein
MRNRRVQTVIVSLGGLGKIEDEDIGLLLWRDFETSQRYWGNKVGKRRGRDAVVATPVRLCAQTAPSENDVSLRLGDRAPPGEELDDEEQDDRANEGDDQATQVEATDAKRAWQQQRE